jgi:hypothetical protein
VNQSTARRIDLDVLRIFACYLLIPFHVAMVFNPAPFYHVRNGELSQVLMIACGFISLWHMPLLFLLAGWSAFASFRSRGLGRFVEERFRRLVVPLLAGCVLLAPGIKYLELRSGLDLNFHGLRVAVSRRASVRSSAGSTVWRHSTTASSNSCRRSTPGSAASRGPPLVHRACWPSAPSCCLCSQRSRDRCEA